MFCVPTKTNDILKRVGTCRDNWDFNVFTVVTDKKRGISHKGYLYLLKLVIIYKLDWFCCHNEWPRSATVLGGVERERELIQK